MHGFVEPLTFDVRPWKAGQQRTLPRHFGWPHQRLEGDVFGAPQHARPLQHRRKRNPDPRNDHGPALNAAMATDALLESGRPDHIFQKVLGWPFDETIDRNAPRPGL
jgi:hypothetical protein